MWHIAMVFKGLSIQIARFHSQSKTGGGGVFARQKILIPVQELWLKMVGALYVRGGVFTGHYGIYEYGTIIFVIIRTHTHFDISVSATCR